VVVVASRPSSRPVSASTKVPVQFAARQAGVPLRHQPVTCDGLSCRQRVERLADCIAGAVAQDNADDRTKLRRYLEQKAARPEGSHWRAYHAARHRLP
jgi:hypothetical protein